MPRAYDAIDDGIDQREQWSRVLDVVCTLFTDQERVVWTYFMLGVPTDQIALLVTKDDGAPITRQRVDQLVRKSLGKLFAVLANRPAPKPSSISRASIRRREAKSA